MLKWLKDKGCVCNEYTFISAAKRGDLEGMIWLRVNRCPWDKRTFHSAVNKGDIEQMEWLKINECPMSDYIDAENHIMGDETIVRWFNTNGYRVVHDIGFVEGDGQIPAGMP